ncbi:MAG: phage virion morphogenesis protein [Gammaproteobacteria bacterium]|nr:phage virion morphogenesis protein [Gammaproteobacteria bacterium]
MTGAHIKFDSDIDNVEKRLRGMIKAAENPGKTAYKDVGEYLLRVHHDRFKQQETPDGQSWETIAPLSEKYKNSPRKLASRRGADKILILKSYLDKELRYQATDDELLFGTDAPYGATHQFGDEGRNIPARPYLGLSKDDEEEIRHIMSLYMHDSVMTPGG